MANSLREGDECKSVHIRVEDDVNNIKGSYRHKFQRGQNSKPTYFRHNHHFCSLLVEQIGFPTQSHIIIILLFQNTQLGKRGNFEKAKNLYKYHIMLDILKKVSRPLGF